VVTYTGQVTYTAAANKNDGVLLKVVSDTGDVSPRFHTVCESYSCNLTESGVRLLRCGSGNLCANSTLLGRVLIDGLVLDCVEALLHNGGLGLVCLVLSALLYKLIKGRHPVSPFFG
jgi:hypothetical protein